MASWGILERVPISNTVVPKGLTHILWERESKTCRWRLLAQSSRLLLCIIIDQASFTGFEWAIHSEDSTASAQAIQ